MTKNKNWNWDEVRVYEIVHSYRGQLSPHSGYVLRGTLHQACAKARERAAFYGCDQKVIIRKGFTVQVVAAYEEAK